MNRRSFLKLLGITPVVPGVLVGTLDANGNPQSEKEVAQAIGDIYAYELNTMKYNWGCDSASRKHWFAITKWDGARWKIHLIQESPFTGQQIDMNRYTDLVNRS
jgi:hypothetical protein